MTPNITPDGCGAVTENNVASAVRAGERLAAAEMTPKPFDIDLARGARGLLVPDGYTLERVDQYTATPAAKRGHSTFNDVPSFAAYVNAHKGPGTVIAYEVSPATLIAFFDHHTPSTTTGSVDVAGWARHSAALKFQPSREMAAWRGIDGKALSQVALAEFLEDRTQDVREPSGTSLLELVQKFEDTRTARFASAVDLHSGACDLTYAVKDAAAPTTQARVPREITLGLPPFVGDPPFGIRARLRYRVTDGALQITVRLVQIDDVIEAAVRDRVALVETSTGIRPLFGTLSHGDAHKVG